MSGSDELLNNYLVVGALLFTLGAVGFLTRRNLIVMFLCAELMLQGVSLTLVGFSGYHGTWGGQVMSIFSLSLAAAEAGIALALFVVLFRRGHSLDVSIWQDLREEDQPPVEDDHSTDVTVPEPVWPHLAPAGHLPDHTPPAGRYPQTPVGVNAEGAGAHG
ncbi:MAG: NADH-quinone oxidoreductase subunit NuoK [Planctomycetaceae bacterium]|nr:MAG: NADH-quinone oxidoreductase subunit NuoK [Planctomycetaceae bacterium]